VDDAFLLEVEKAKENSKKIQATVERFFQLGMLQPQGGFKAKQALQ
jgi:hypothetical protein